MAICSNFVFNRLQAFQEVSNFASALGKKGSPRGLLEKTSAGALGIKVNRLFRLVVIDLGF